MTAAELIHDIFARRHAGLPPDQRRVSPEQLVYLRDLMIAEEHLGTVKRGQGKSMVYRPAGNVSYVLTEDRVSQKHTLTELPKFAPATTGSLFDADSID